MSTPHPLRDRTFRLLFTARALSLTGDAAVPAALALAVLRVTGSSSALALVLACAMIPRLILLPIGGVVADRLNARTVAIATDLVSFVAQLFAAFELLSGHPKLWHLAIAQVISGAAAGFAAPTISSLVAGTVQPHSLQRANAALSMANGATRLAGPALAGTFVLTVGPGWTFLLDAASFGASAALLALITVRHVPSPRRSLRADLAEGWSEVRSRDWYWSSLIAHGVWNGAMGVMLTLGPVLAVDRLGGEGIWIATLQAGALGLVLGSFLASRIRPRRPILIANLALATFAAPLALLAVTAPAPLVIAAYGIALTGLGILNPTWETVVQTTVPPQVLARVTSYDWLLSLGAAPLAYALAPAAASAWGPSVPLAITAALVGTACLATAAVPGVRNLTAPTPTHQQEAPSAPATAPAN
ncbi:MFS transporter [Actinomadura barringtoniae]|uniref:MFS transporter n=1 Tax=Actinomadura barringtoniae TaxID=1427535 RepID=A0A939PMJ9_9ACTN|nr:MFS transporter [Actinomadura barringtoniae]MBO2455546.1 MFS transporter [Actinomadura barringtoniae]